MQKRFEQVGEKNVTKTWSPRTFRFVDDLREKCDQKYGVLMEMTTVVENEAEYV